MATDVQPSNDNALGFIGTGEFSFAEGYLTAAAALGKPFLDFGDVEAFAFQTNSESKVITRSVRGFKRERGTRVTLARFSYELKCSEFRAELIRYLFSGDPNGAGNYTQVVRAAVAADAIAAPIKHRWYDLTITGAEVREATTIAVVPAAGSLTEDVDYKIDYKLCRLRWITTPVTLTAINITAPAIVATDPLAFKRSIPLVTPIRKGIGRVTLFDKVGAVTDVVYDHKGFYCEVMATGNVSVDGTNPSVITANVKVLSPSGDIYSRDDASYVS
jgi:hypothetical protein